MKALKNYEQLYERLYGTPEKKGAGRAPPHSAFKNNDDDWVGFVFGFRITLGRFIRTIAQSAKDEQGDRASGIQIPHGGPIGAPLTSREDIDASNRILAVSGTCTQTARTFTSHAVLVSIFPWDGAQCFVFF